MPHKMGTYDGRSMNVYGAVRSRRVARGLPLALLGLILLSGCAPLAGPDYQRPEAPSKAAWSNQEAAPPVSAQATIQPDWWTGFEDPDLDHLIDRAIAGNIDIQILAARTGVAKAAISQARAGLLPTITGGEGPDSFKSTGRSRTTQYSAASELNWEIDIWGKVRKGVQAQHAEYKASEADWRAGYLTLVSDVATAYFQIRQFDEQIDQQQQTVDRNQQILGIYASMYDEGLVPETQVLQQQAEINRLQTGLLELKRLRKVTENGLATLLGMAADTLHVPKAQSRATPHSIDVPAGLPSDLLSRRPDIISAEYRVLQAYDLEGQARLARFPTVGLTGRGGTASFALSDLLKSWTFGLSSLVSIPIFDPNISAQIKVSEAQTRVATEEYRRTVVGAFEEVENALTNLASRKAQQEELSSRRQKLVTVSEQVQAQLEEGVVSQLEVFEVERTLLDAEQQMLANHWQILTDTVALYKALGGGWPKEVLGLSRD
jgi:NodT family efflux transporter outer membrane factor (OMF) lipoprotein